MRKPLLGIAAIVGSLLILVATTVLIRNGVLQSREARGFRFALRDAVYAVEQERYGEARTELLEASEHASSPTGWLRLLKVSRRLPDRELYVTLLRTGREQFTSDESLTAALAYEELRNGDGKEAWSLLEGTVDPERYSSLYAGALLAAGVEPPAVDSEDVRLFADLPETDTPAPFVRAYELTGAIAFLENGLILTLESGDFESAEGILRRIEPQEASELGSESMRLLLHASHTLNDSPRFYTVLRHLGGRGGTEPEALLLQADLRMSARELGEAERLYGELRNVAPAVSLIPYLNGAWLRRRREEPAIELLETGVRRFPENRELQAALLKELLHRGEEEEARARMTAMAPFSTSKLLRIAFFRSPENDAGYTARLWQLLNEEGNAPEVARLLAYHLVGINDLPELRRLLDRFSEENHPWARFYHGYLQLRRGNHARADEIFADAPEAGSYPVEPWLWHGNGALAALYTGSYRRGREESERAARLLVASEDEESEKHLGTILSIQAEALRLSGSPDEALQVARRAVSLSPSSSSARLILRNLERRR